MPPFDAQAQDSYFVVAHFHFVMGGGALLSFLAALYYWFPKMTGKMLPEGIGKWAFGFLVFGFWLIFMPQHLLGLLGMPRRIQTYEAGIGLELGNLLSTLGTAPMGLGMVMILGSVVWALRYGKVAGNDPWDGRTLEWATTSPPPYYDFAEQPLAYDRDAFWAAKHPDSDHVETTARGATEIEYDQHGIHMPGQSWYPFISSLALIVAGFGILYDNFLLAGLMGVLMIIAFYGWAFEGVGGHHVHPEASSAGEGD
jgi:cytochrome c oxidase subunit 1